MFAANQWIFYNFVQVSWSSLYKTFRASWLGASLRNATAYNNTK